MLFSILIPTRNRPDTLASTLGTCAHASWSDVEVVVFDNSDPEHNAEVANCVHNAKCEWIRYVKNPESPCSMSRNWSLAFKEARGEYVTFLGDDDGFLESSLSVVKTIIAQSGADAVTWPTAVYYWPTATSAPTRGQLSLRFGNRCGTVQWTPCDGRAAISSALRHPRSYDVLPMVYNSFVHRSIIGKARQSGDDIFISQSPDVYSGFFVAAFATNVVRADTPLSVRGASGHSNGVAHMTGSVETTRIRSDFDSLNRTTAWRAVRGAANVGVFTPQVTDSFSRFAECFPQAVRGIALSPDRIALNQVIEVFWLYDDQATRAAAVAALNEYYANDRSALHSISGFVNRSSDTSSASAPVTYGLGDGVFHLRGCEFGVSDIASACQFAEKLFSLREVCRTVPSRSTLRRIVRELCPPLLLKGWHSFRQFYVLQRIPLS